MSMEILAAGTSIITYGGGEILYRVLDAIAQLVNGGGGIVRPLMLMAAYGGGILVIYKTFFSNSYEALIKGFLFPLLLFSFSNIFSLTCISIICCSLNK